MKKIQLRLWHPIAGFTIVYIFHIINENLISSMPIKTTINDILPIGTTVCQFLFLYIIIRNIAQAVKRLVTRRNSGKAEELERQREAERREIDMIRKSNDILIHLIQDEHREEGDR